MVIQNNSNQSECWIHINTGNSALPFAIKHVSARHRLSLCSVKTVHVQIQGKNKRKIHNLVILSKSILSQQAWNMFMVYLCLICDSIHWSKVRCLFWADNKLKDWSRCDLCRAACCLSAPDWIILWLESHSRTNLSRLKSANSKFRSTLKSPESNY